MKSKSSAGSASATPIQGATAIPNPVAQGKGRTGADLAKVRADIGFLQDRIAVMQALSNPNRAVLQTYQTMLARREAALTMLVRSAAVDTAVAS